jgi:excisionase family DNA binding protein
MPRIRETIAHRIEAAAVVEIDEARAREMVSEGAFSVREAVAFSGLSITQLTKHMDNGALPYVRDGRARRIPRKALKDFLALRLVRRDDLVLLPETPGVQRRKTA